MTTKPKTYKYINPNKIPTRVMTPDGAAIMLEPYDNRRIGAFRNSRTFVVELDRDFGDGLARTGQIRRAPVDMQEIKPDEEGSALQKARLDAIEQQKIRRAEIEATRDLGADPSLDPMDRALERMNTTGDEAPELDTEHAAPVVAEVSAGDSGGGLDEDAPTASAVGEGMSRKKRRNK